MGLVDRIIDNGERGFGENLDYLRAIARSSAAAFWKFALGFMPFAAHRKHAPKEAYWFAKLGAVRFEDCGPCVQTVITLAQRDGMAVEDLHAALVGKMGGEFQDAYNFGFAVSANDVARIEALRSLMISRYGENALGDLAIGIATSRVYPAIKRTLGFAQSCTLPPTREMPEASASGS